MFRKFLELGVLKRVRSESLKSLVSHGSCKTAKVQTPSQIAQNNLVGIFLDKPT